MVCPFVHACIHAFIHSLPSLSWSAPATTLLSLTPCSLCSLATLALVQFLVSSKLLLPRGLGLEHSPPHCPSLQISSGKPSLSPFQLDVVPLFYSLGFPSFFVLFPPIIVLITFVKNISVIIWWTSLHHSTGDRNHPCGVLHSNPHHLTQCLLLKYSKHSIFTEWVNELGF